MPHANVNDTPNDEVVYPKHENTIETTTTISVQHPKDNNNSSNSSSKDSSQHQRLPRQTTTNAGPTLKTSIYDWDSPSSFTGTVKWRPHSLATESTTPSPSSSPTSSSSTSTPSSTTPTFTNNDTTVKSTTEVSSIAGNRTTLKRLRESQVNNNKREQRFFSSSRQQRHSRRLQRQTIHVDHRTPLGAAGLLVSTPEQASTRKMSNMQKSHRNKEKPSKLRLTKSADRNANSTASFPTSDQNNAGAVGGTIRKSSRVLQSRLNNVQNEQKTSKKSRADNHQRYSRETYNENDTTLCDANYMELNFYDPTFPSAEFTELFCDFPVSYESTTIVTAAQFAKNGLVNKPPPQPPPYREPPPPTPPPISQMPTREARQLAQQALPNAAISISAPATPSRGKVVLSKKERKELNKLHKLQDSANAGSTTNLGTFELGETGSVSAQCSPYKGRVSELKNCIARGLFASLNRSSQKSLNSNPTLEDPPSSNEASPPPPAPDNSPPNSMASNNNDADYTEKLKNLPVRQRKTHISHMDNYCLFDPVDFINEKALRNRNNESLLMLTRTHHGLRDPLFSSRQNLDFGEEEMVPEVIYDEQEQEDVEEACGGINDNNFDHHNYFVIDPDDFEEEPMADIGIPNPYTNEQFVNAKLEPTVTANNEEELIPTSESLNKLLEAFEAAPSMSNSQESKDTNTTASTTTTTSTALVESSTSTNSNSSSTSATSSQTTLQRTKKKLTFLNLSPFRSQNSKSATDAADGGKNSKSRSSDNKSSERAVSELLSADHMLHLQHMLLDGKDNLRSRTVPIESNYVLFNPGPVPSRNVQYKIRKPRPLSTHSDADSGFLSPCSPDELSSLKFNPAILVLQQCDSVQGYIEVSGLFRMTKAFCESYNKSWVLINKCRLRATSRDISKFYLNATFLHPAHKIDFNMAVVKKGNGGYKPFPMNATVDACEYTRKRNNPIVNVVFKLFKEYSNINHTCPYMGDQILDGFYARHDLFKLPLPNGEYGILFTWYLHKQKVFVTNIYFVFDLAMN